METKKCSSCEQILGLSEFHYSQSGSGKRKSKCKDCSAKYFQDYKKKNTESLRNKWRDASKRYHTTERRRARTLKKYNLTPDGYKALFESQDGSCAICHRAITLVIDHDHNTGLVRGLLCNGCNLALGYFEDDVKRMRLAIKYIAG